MLVLSKEFNNNILFNFVRFFYYTLDVLSLSATEGFRLRSLWQYGALHIILSVFVASISRPGFNISKY